MLILIICIVAIFGGLGILKLWRVQKERKERKVMLKNRLEHLIKTNEQVASKKTSHPID